MAKNEIHYADIGTAFEITLQDDSTVVNISAATTKQIIFQKPDGTTVTETADFVTDGTDGKIQYVIASGDLDTVGTWSIQAKIIISTNTWYSDIQTFEVHGNI